MPILHHSGAVCHVSPATRRDQRIRAQPLSLAAVPSAPVRSSHRASCSPHPPAAEPGYPKKPVTIMMPYGAGGLGDVTLRMYAQKFAPRLGQQFIIDSRPGAGGAIAARAALAQPADGYTLFFCGSGMAIYPRGGCEQTTAQQANVLTAVLV